MSQIILNLVTSGSTYPIQVYVSDVYGNNSVLVDTITSGPIPPDVYITSVPEIFDTAPQVMVTMIDANDCSVFHIVDCTVSATPTPTLTSTPTTTPTLTQTPTTSTTTTLTPTITPSPTSEPLYVYLFPEPQDETSLTDLGQHMLDQGAEYFFGYGNSGSPSEINYSDDLEIYTSYSGFTDGGGSKFRVPVSGLTSTINQTSSSIIDNYQCIQAPNTFGSIKVSNTDVDFSETYFYSVWIPVNSVPIDWVNMSVDISIGTQCTGNLVTENIPSEILSQKVVTINNDTSIPAGEYRVLWMTLSALISPELANSNSIYFKGRSIYSALPTPTPSVTSTQVTPTPTPTMTSTPQVYNAYVVPEPQDSTSLASLGSFMLSQGSEYFFGFGNSGSANMTNYSDEMDIYIKYSGFTNGGGSKFKVPVSTLTSTIRQEVGQGIDDFGCNVDQYNMGTVRITSGDVDVNEKYFYTIWIPYDSIPINKNMSISFNIANLSSACDSPIFGGTIPDPTFSFEKIIVTSGGAIPAGEYRVLWMPLAAIIPQGLPLHADIFIKGSGLV